MGKLRAVIYNRCSTEEEAQKDALAKQVQESRNCVEEQGWQLVDTYVEAKSGTTVKGRSEYNRLYHDLERDKFDIIVIKSQDRLMRNTKDWYLFLDRMQRNRKQLYIYLEHKFYTPDDALLTGIKARLAEEYSRELSKKINNAHRNRQKEGKSFSFTNRIYGLKKLPDKKIVIDEQEAEMIRTIFELAADGYGAHCSAEILYQKGYRNRNGKMIGSSSIRNMIRNPIYKGTVVQNRQHYDFESKQIIKNPQSEWIIHDHAVPAIVSKELFEEANCGLDARRQEGNRDGAYRRGKNKGKYDLSGKLSCGLCGNMFYRTVRQRKDGQITEWKCSNYLQNGRMTHDLRRDQIRKAKKEEGRGCDNVHLDEKKLYQVLEQLDKRHEHSLEDQKDILLKETLSILRKALGKNDVLDQKEKMKVSMEKIARQKDILLNKLLDGVISDDDFKVKNEELQDKMEYMDEEIKKIEEDTLQNEKLENRIKTIRKKLEEGVIEEARAADMVESIKKIEVFPACLKIYFDSWSIMGIPKENFYQRNGSADIRKEADKLAVVQIPQTCSTSHQPMIEEEKKVILGLMRETPAITAKGIAEAMEVNLSLVHRRIKELKSEGKIIYSTPNGRGKWLVFDSGVSEDGSER